MRLVCLTAFALLLAVPSRAETVRGDPGPDLDAYLTRLAGVGWSGAAAVRKDGEIVLQKGYGLAERETGRPVTAATVFTVGSITKQFTAAAILKLQEMGKLRVTDPITRYFDDVPEDKRSILLHHLLTHTAGFPGAIGDDFDLDATRDRFVEQAMAVPLHRAPGAGYEYSNVGFSLLAVIVEMVSGESYEEFLAESFFRPLGMTRTGYLLPGFTPDELAVGYRDGERWGTILERPFLEDGPSWHLRGNGAIHTTGGDMMKWTAALMGGAALSADSRAALFAPYVPENPEGDSYYGYGWSIAFTPRDTKVVLHNGGNMVFSADCRMYVDEGVSFFLTSTSNDYFIDFISNQVAGILFGYDVEMPPETVSLDPAALGKRAGVYELPGGGSLEVTAGENRLRIRGRGDEARKALVGEVSGPRVDTLRERQAAITAAWMDGDLAPMSEAMGGGLSPEELAEGMGEIHRMRLDELGPYRDFEVSSVLAAPQGLAVTVAMHYEKGTGFVRFMWEGGELVGIRPARSEPGGTVEVYPVSPSAFRAFSLREPVRVEVAFEEGDGRRTLILTTAAGVVRAAEAR